MAEHWRWADPSGQQRKIRTDELRAALAGGVIAPNTPVWRPGWSSWIAAQDVPELTTSALSAANGVVPNIPPPPLEVVAVQHAFEAHAKGPESVADFEPPPPPAYVPAPTRGTGLVPPAPASSQRNLGGRPSAAPASAPAAPVSAPAAPASAPAAPSQAVTTAVQGSIAQIVATAPALATLTGTGAAPASAPAAGKTPTAPAASPAPAAASPSKAPPPLPSKAPPPPRRLPRPRGRAVAEHGPARRAAEARGLALQAAPAPAFARERAAGRRPHARGRGPLRVDRRAGEGRPPSPAGRPRRRRAQAGDDAHVRRTGRHGLHRGAERIRPAHGRAHGSVLPAAWAERHRAGRPRHVRRGRAPRRAVQADGHAPRHRRRSHPREPPRPARPARAGVRPAGVRQRRRRRAHRGRPPARARRRSGPPPLLRRHPGLSPEEARRRRDRREGRRVRGARRRRGGRGGARGARPRGPGPREGAPGRGAGARAGEARLRPGEDEGPRGPGEEQSRRPRARRARRHGGPPLPRRLRVARPQLR